MGSLLFYISVLVVASAVVWRGGGLLESSAEALAKHYQLSPIIQGSIITAVGSSFPELSTTVISTLLHGAFDLGVAAIVGSAIFNILMIPGLSAVDAKRLSSQWTFVVKDVQFYLTSIVVLLLTFALAVIYYPVEGSSLKGELTRGIALLPVLLYGFYLLLQQQENIAYRQQNNKEDKVAAPSIRREWLRFGLSLILIVLSVEGLVQSVLFLGDYFDTPHFAWGAIVLAAATSVPDAVVSIRIARNEQGVTSLANVIGSNIFDLLIAVPAGILIAGRSVVNFEIAMPLMAFLGLATVLLIAMLLRKSQLSRREGWILIAVYGIFALWISLESLNVVDWIGEQ